MVKLKQNTNNDDNPKRLAASRAIHQRITVALLLVSMIVCITVFLWFQSANYQRIVSQNLNYIEDYALQETNQLEQNLKSAESLISNAAKQYSTLSSMKPDMAPTELISAIYDNSLFDRLAYISPDGQYISLEETADVSNQAYFQYAMHGVTGRQALRKSRITKEPGVIFYAPVTVDGVASGAMAGFYEQNMLRNLFTKADLNYNPYTYLLDGEGNVITGSESSKTASNILDIMSELDFSQNDSYSAIIDFFKDESQHYISFSYGKAPRTEVGTIVKFNDSNWMLMSTLDNSVTGGMVRAANRIGTMLESILVVVFLFYIFTILLSFRRQENYLRTAVENATSDLNNTLKEERKQQAIIGSLASIYSYSYYINLSTMQYKMLRRADRYAAMLPDTGSIFQAKKIYEEQLVWPSFKSEISEFLDPNTLADRISGVNSLSIEYQRSDSKWCRGTFVATEWDSAGKVTSVVYGIQIIEGEKQKEQATQSALHDAYEAAQLANRAKTAFLSNMSHDMRTPMNAIIGLTGIAGAHLDDPDRVSDCLGKITASSKHLLSLINEVLDMSKIESGKVYLTEEEFNLSDLVENMLALNQPLVNEKGHTLSVNVQNLMHENVIGDSVRLQQVFTNLLSNAVKYTPDGGTINICITEKNWNNSTSWFEAVFEDNGIGMTDEFRQQMFEPFSRADDKRIDKIQGTGLGMPIARNIIRMMDGDITVESELGKGSKFTVTFSLKLQDDTLVSTQQFAGLSILVVDDDVIACESAGEILGSLGMNCEWTLSGEDALKKVSSRHKADNDYYAIILDWKMPGMNGLETAREIRKIVGAAMPIIIISAYDWSEIEQEAKDAGAGAFISKPMFKSRVVRLFNELMGNNTPPEPKNIVDVMQQHNFNGKRVLLAEDNELNAEIAVEILDMAGLKVETVPNGKEAVDTFAQSEPGYFDLIFMDIQMPIMDGYEAAAAIRKLGHANAKSIPIVAMTANAFASDVQAALDAGMNGHISKPLDPEHLIKVLAKNLA